VDSRPAPDDPRAGGTVAGLLAARAGESPRASFLEDARSTRVLDYAAMHAATLAWAELLDELGVPAGGAVLLSHGDPLSFASVHLGVIAAGRRSIPLAPDASSAEFEKISSQLGGVALLVTDRGTSLSGAASAAVDGMTGAPIDVIAAETPEPGPVEADERTAGVWTPTSSGSAEGSAVLFTSGSTGEPKGVELPERQLLFVARQIAANNRLIRDDRGYSSLPLFHVNAEVVGLLSTLVSGGTLVLDASFHRTGFWELLHDRRITWLNAVPAMLAVLTRGGSVIPENSLRFIRCASAPLPETVRKALDGIPLVLSWGMTEGASQITATPLGQPVRPGSVGLPRGSEVQVRASDGSVARTGEIGPLWVRGPGVVSGYLFGRAADRFDDDGWLSTGDVGCRDEDGWVYLVSRSDDVINRGGEKVYPAEVEEVLLRDSRVLEAVVVGRPDEVLGQVPVAYVIAAPNSDTEGLAQDLVELARTDLARFKRPDTVSIVDDLPRAPTGKVQRARVRELAEGGS
jgi:acyl-CoA synthetase (AMP-forming)/AMP-acid ligase II